MQADIQNGCPDNREATGLRRKHVNLIRTLPYIAEQTLDGIGGLNVAVHSHRKRIKREEMLFVLSEASHRLGIAHSVLGFEGGQLCQRLLLGRLLPNPNQFGLDIAAFSFGDGGEHIALFMHQAALARRSCKQFCDGGKQSIVPVGDDEIDLGCPACS